MALSAQNEGVWPQLEKWNRFFVLIGLSLERIWYVLGIIIAFFVYRKLITAKVKLLFQLSEYRLELYYAFGILCLASWFAFNLWILRDYFFLAGLSLYIPKRIGVPIGGNQITHNSAGRPIGQQRAQSVTTTNSAVLPSTKQRYSLEANRQILDVDRYYKTQYCSKTPFFASNTSNYNIKY
uniref:Uncharacterized protein n=1 Tax=Ditylenchus dipsaci TaxID=166011 RepID=A0A915DQY7_9BILA